MKIFPRNVCRIVQFLLVAFLCLSICSCSAQPIVKLGSDVLVEKHLDLLKEKRVGLITNQTGLLSSGDFLVDVLRSRKVNVVALFGPEHGIRGESPAGERISDSVDVRTGIHIFSLYGKIKKPMLTGVDVLVYDVQDVGARLYTYISTMTLAMEAAAEANIPFIVLDRPNPLGGTRIEGPIMEDSLRSFVGMLPIPVVYGLTCGELARMINGEGWLTNGVKANLNVVPMEGWKRSMLWDDTRLRWIRPSPNIPSSSTAIVYPATCFIEASNLSEGRGTDSPFNIIGAPFIDGVKLAAKLHLEGVTTMPVTFLPNSSKFKGEECRGLSIEITDPASFKPILFGLSLLQEIHNLYPEKFILTRSSFNRLFGNAKVYDLILNGTPPESIVVTWHAALEGFKARSDLYKLYEEQ